MMFYRMGDEVIDYNAEYVRTGQNPQNFILRTDIDHFPKIKLLNDLKNANIEASRLHPPLHVTADLRTADLASLLRTQFESILIDPPWYEYYARSGGFPPKCNHNESTIPWTFEEIRALRIEDISATPSFCFLWCGNKHVEQGTACLLKWGFRRIEDVCWVKTNGHIAPSDRIPEYLPAGSLNILHTTKEHLLVGIKGSVQRSRDSYLIHANVDSDILIAPQETEFGCTRKPDEVYSLIERFCNSQRRLELFGQDHNLRPGWVTVGGDLTGPSNYDPAEYNRLTSGPNQFIRSTTEIDRLRPKSPKAAYRNTQVPPANPFSL